MEVITMTTEAFLFIKKHIEEINNRIAELEKKPKDAVLDNDEFLKFMSISKRTAQAWRDDGLITFSQVGAKIYYKMSDIEDLLARNKRIAFKKKLQGSTK